MSNVAESGTHKRSGNNWAILKSQKLALSGALILISIFVISWGQLGHETVADIAANHLSPNAKAAVSKILNNETMASVSNWADQVEDKETRPEHYINLELGLSHNAFVGAVQSINENNVIKAIAKYSAILNNHASSQAEKLTALKFIIHLVGDIHQPMHVSRAEDRGGNQIAVTYAGHTTNLHSLWDSQMLQHAGLNDGDLARNFDNASAGDIKKWQGDPVVEWAWESYSISSELYAAAGQPDGHDITDAYYQKYMPVMQLRIEKAGIRLAGLLNNPSC